jgi:hypothetical protein
MTAEVAIVNSGAIALAADSAVTIGGQKIYNSAIKLFALSKTEPVAIMIYGNANLLDVPWETLIKSFRILNGIKKFDKLEEYSQEFLNYLVEKAEYFSENAQKSWFFGNINSNFSMIRDEIFHKARLISEEKGEVTDNDFLEVLNSTICAVHSNVKDKDFTIDMTEYFENLIREKYLSDINNVIETVFEKTPLSEEINAKLHEIAVCLLTRDIFLNGTSGVVVAGFGDKEIYPSIITHEIETFFEGKLKHKCVKNKSTKIQNGSHCTIIAFAQEDMVHTFMKGINPAVSDMLVNYISQLFTRLPELLDSHSISDEIKADFSEKSKELLDDFFNQFQNHIQQEHISPVLNMVEVLPKDELAAMAEALVHLTAFKRKMTVGMETVGGPIDVAVISKGDGFVWVKRKHYFPAELNQHFFTNYFRGLNNGSNQ